MLVRVSSCALSGLDAFPVDVEVKVSRGDKYLFTIIGLGDSAIRESKERIVSAIRASGFKTPNRILVNLAPAEVKKQGASFDLPIAAGILMASGHVPIANTKELAFIGEVALDGRVKPVRGAVSLAVAARQSGIKRLVVPTYNHAEAALISGLEIISVSSLVELVSFLSGKGVQAHTPKPINLTSIRKSRSLSDVWGQEAAKRALIIAAAGGHNILIIMPYLTLDEFFSFSGASKG